MVIAKKNYVVLLNFKKQHKGRLKIIGTEIKWRQCIFLLEWHIIAKLTRVEKNLQDSPDFTHFYGYYVPVVLHFFKIYGTIWFELEKIYISSYKLLLLSDRFKIPSFYISIQQNLLESEVNVLYGRKISSSTKFFLIFGHLLDEFSKGRNRTIKGTTKTKVAFLLFFILYQ